MLKKINELKETLQEFIDQRDFFMMVVRASESEMILLLKILQGIERESTTDIFLLFPSEITSLEIYVSIAIHSIENQINEGNTIRKNVGLPLWPNLPNQCNLSMVSPENRMRKAMMHIRTFFPLENNNRIVWGFLPINIVDTYSYKQLISSLLPRNSFEAWMRGHRILLREDPDNPFLISWFEKEAPKGVVICDIDLSPQAMTNELVLDAQDRNLPASERMQALMQLAALDFSHKRYDQAIEKYGVLFNYYQEQDQPAMQALCLSGHGDILRQSGQLEEAKKRYQQAIALAVRAESLPVMLNLFLATGDCSLALEQLDDAEGYFNFANQTAAKTFNVYAKCDAMEKIGMVQVKLNEHASAIDIWQKGIKLSKTNQYHVRAKSILNQLAPLLKEKGLNDEYSICMSQLDEIQSQINQKPYG